MVPIAALAGVLVAGYVPTSRDPHAPRTDRLGFALSTAMVALLVYTIIEAPSHGWGSAWTLGSFALTAAVGGRVRGWERRTEQPMLDLSLFRNPRFTAASASVAISFFALSGFIFLVTQYFQFLKGYGPLSTGVRLLPVASFVAISRSSARGSPCGSVRSWSSRPGCWLMAAFYLWVTITSATTGYGTIAAQMVVLGTGMGLTSAPATEAIMGVVPKAKAGVGSAVNDATRLLGGTLGVAVIGSIYASLYASRLTSALPARMPASSRGPRTRPSAPRSPSLTSSPTPAIRRSRPPSTTRQARPSSTASTRPTTLAAGVAAAGAVMALALLPAHPTFSGEDTTAPALALPRHGRGTS